jgi:hypothetical protein
MKSFKQWLLNMGSWVPTIGSLRSGWGAPTVLLATYVKPANATRNSDPNIYGPEKESWGKETYL